MSITASENFKVVKNPEESSQSSSKPHQNSNTVQDVHPSRGMRLLVVDQNTQVRSACCEIAESSGFAVAKTDSAEIARSILKQRGIAILLLDVTHPEGEGQSLLQQMKTLYPEIQVIAMSAGATIESAVDIMRMGACDYLSKPFPLNVLTEALEQASRRWHFGMERRKLQETLPQDTGIVDALGQSLEMEKLYRILSKVADSMHPVMILGESGSGKSLVAQSIHSSGPHAAKPFVALDCTSLGPALLEETLFGNPEHTRRKTDLKNCGLLTSPGGGTVFLDEIGNLPLDLQSRLTRALTDKEIRRTEAAKPVRISVRILAATSRDLTQMVAQGRFRMDLYRLLSVVNLRIPPLRGRPDDIAFLTKRFLEKIQRQTGFTHTLSDETLQLLETYDWPDNVRELEQAIGRACSQSTGPELDATHLPQKLLRFARNANIALPSPAALDPAPHDAYSKQSTVPIAQVEQLAILKAMRETNGNKLQAAALLGIGKSTLYRKLKEYALSNKSDALPAPLTTTPAEAIDTQPVCA